MQLLWGACLNGTLPFLNSSTAVRHPCFSPLQPWISWPAKTNRVSQHQPETKTKAERILNFAVYSTCFIVTAVWTLDATASTRALIRKKFTDWFFCLMAFSAWIRATSIFPFWIAWGTHKHNPPQQQSSAVRTCCYKYWFRRCYLLFLLYPSLLFLLYHTSWSFSAALLWQTLNWKDALRHGVNEKLTTDKNKLNNNSFNKNQPASHEKYHCAVI